MTYDVATEEPEGRRRLRDVAKVCEGFGQRVQKSVFECALTEAELTLFEHRLAGIIDPVHDSLRIYRLRQPRSRFLTVLGVTPEFDIHEPLIV